MAAHFPTPSLPELDERLREERGAIVGRLDALRHRVRSDLHELAPRQQLKHHTDGALAGVAIGGLVAGRIVGGLLRLLLR